MSWRSARWPVLAATVCLAALAACGFRPLYSKDSGGSADQLAEIRISPIADRVGQQLHNLLLDKLNPKGPPAKPRYVLAVKVNEFSQNLAVRKDEVATRANLIVRVNFGLTRVKDGAALMSSNAVSANSYNLVASEFGTLSARNDARARAVRELSDEIKLQLGVYLSRAK